jgi:hypothetical protein
MQLKVLAQGTAAHSEVSQRSFFKWLCAGGASTSQRTGLKRQERGDVREAHHPFSFTSPVRPGLDHAGWWVGMCAQVCDSTVNVAFTVQAEKPCSCRPTVSRPLVSQRLHSVCENVSGPPQTPEWPDGGDGNRMDRDVKFSRIILEVLKTGGGGVLNAYWVWC